MSIRMLGLGAVLLSAILLIVALVGGMTVESPESGTVLAHAASADEERPALSGAGRPNGHDDHHDDHIASDQAGHQGAR